MNDHLSYVSENLYEDASRVIFDKIAKHYGIENRISSPHDTAILIDSTGSMASMINQYKAEAYRLAKETLESGGRVALYDYRDLSDPYEPVKHCDFNDCTLEIFQAELEQIHANNGGDTPESLLSASLHVMTDLEWKYGSTKSLVVLTDANFLSPDRDGITFDEVVALSKRIDPVNFYIITNADYGDDYEDLARETSGRVVTNCEELSLLTNYIMERYDSLPRVEENNNLPELPTLEINEIKYGENEAEINFTTNGSQTLVILNDAILGITDKNILTIGELNLISEKAVLNLIPLGSDVRGESVSVELKTNSNLNNPLLTIPKAPNTGRGKLF